MYSQEEHQEIVLMLGSKKEWQKYLGLDDKTGTSTWTSLKLVPPTTWFKSKSKQEQLELLGKHGSIKALAQHISVSEAFLRTFFIEPKGQPHWDEEEILELFKKYRSVRLLSRMSGYTEASIRKRVIDITFEITDLIDYSTGDHSNAKGRRAELDFARIRGEMILEDKNLTEGSQARWDFDDKEFGKVNVKASRKYLYKARTRKSDPEFWKASTAGREDCDYFAFLCYDAKMKNLVGWYMMKSEDAPTTKSIRLQRGQLSDHGLPTN